MKKGSQGGYFFKNPEEILIRTDVKEFVKKVRTKYYIPEEGFGDAVKEGEWTTGMVTTLVNPESEFTSSLYSIFLQEVVNFCIEVLKKPRFYGYFLSRYIISNEVRSSLILRSGKTENTPIISTREVITTNNKKETIIVLEISANTTLKDVHSIWDKVVEIQKTLHEYDRSRRKPKLKRDIELLKASEQGLTLRQIYENSIPQDQDDEVTPDAIRKALKKFKTS